MAVGSCAVVSAGVVEFYTVVLLSACYHLSSCTCFNAVDCCPYVPNPPTDVEKSGNRLNIYMS